MTGAVDREPVTVPAAFAAMPRWWHDAEGRAWLGTLPRRVAEQCRRWGLALDGEPRHGSNALVVPVRRGEEAFALRLAPPGDDVLAEAAALRVWDGRGCVRLVDVDGPARALLLERLDATRTLAAEPLDVAVPVLGGLTRTLAVPTPAGTPSTADVARRGLATLEPAWEALGRPIPRAHLDSALAHAAERAAADPGGRAADGDLHADQVLAGQRAPWLVVDPVLLRGDPEHDLARVLWTRLDEMPRDADVRRAVDAFVDAAGVPADRARAWVVLRSTSYLLWGLERGLTEDPARCRRLLDLFA